jgi:MFS family permease
VTSGLMVVIFAITEAPEEDGRPVTAGVAGTVGILLLVAFAVVELRHPAPLVPLRALAARAVLVPNAAIALQSMVGIAWLYLLTLYFQEVLGHRPLVAGLLFAPMTLSSVVSAPVAGRVAGNLGVRRTALTGFAVTALGLVGMVIGLTPMGNLWLLIPAAVIGEAGFMFSNVALTLAATSSMAEDRSGLAAGVLNTFIQVGGGVGLALVAAVLASTLPGEPIEADAYAASLRWGLVACLGFCLAGLVSVLRGLPASVPARRPD